jgi:protoheme IX farnesyltransferase
LHSLPELKDSTAIPTSSAASTLVRDIAVLFKLRLTLLVVISSVLGYYMGTSSTHWPALIALCAGGVLLTGGSNGVNQVLERNYDRLMHRTKNRPVASGRMLPLEGLAISLIAAAAGISILWIMIGTAAGVLGLAAFLSYAFVYTPMKRVSGLAVFIGAFPGAIPPLLGYIAGTHDYGLEAGLLFAVQFMWQFPHFWAIAWVAHEDYERGGYRLLPFSDGRSIRSAFQIFMYSLFLIPVSLLPWALPAEQPMIGSWGAGAAACCGLVMAWYAWKLYSSCDVKDARKVMFASFFYLPVVQLAYVLDKLA